MIWLSRWLARRRDEADARVLEAVRAGHDYALGIMRATGLRPGRLYPALLRLERSGRVASMREVLPAHADRPRRRLYRFVR